MGHWYLSERNVLWSNDDWGVIKRKSLAGVSGAGFREEECLPVPGLAERKPQTARSQPIKEYFGLPNTLICHNCMFNFVLFSNANQTKKN